MKKIKILAIITNNAVPLPGISIPLPKISLLGMPKPKDPPENFPQNLKEEYLQVIKSIEKYYGKYCGEAGGSLSMKLLATSLGIISAGNYVVNNNALTPILAIIAACIPILDAAINPAKFASVHSWGSGSYYLIANSLVEEWTMNSPNHPDPMQLAINIRNDAIKKEQEIEATIYKVSYPQPS